MAQLRENRVKRKLQRGEVATVISGHNSAEVIDFLGPIGFDGVWLEGEHGPVDYAEIPDMTRACDVWGMTSIARINLNLQGVLYRTLDVGAQGIVVPHINTAEEARQVVDATKFAPIGSRGMATSRQGYGVEGYYHKANDETLVVVLIEDIIAVNNLADILKVDHIDVFFVAPGDLSQSMGYVGQPTHPEVTATIEKAMARITAAGKTAGALVSDATVEEYVKRGARFLLIRMAAVGDIKWAKLPGPGCIGSEVGSKLAQIRENKAKHKLQRGEVVTSVAGQNTPDMIEFLGQFGFDVAWIEAEHGPNDFGDIPHLTRACDVWGMTSVVRVNLNLPGVIYRTLDLGAQGIVVPHVNTAEEARAIVDAAKFAPVGARGSSTGRQGYGVKDYFARANDETLLIALIEDIAAVNNLPEILKVDHIDVFHVPPGDLAQSMGLVGQMNHPRVREAIDSAIEQIVAAGRTAGTLVTDATVEHAVNKGARFLQTHWPRWIVSGATTYLEMVAKATQ